MCGECNWPTNQEGKAMTTTDQNQQADLAVNGLLEDIRLLKGWEMSISMAVLASLGTVYHEQILRKAQEIYAENFARQEISQKNDQA